MDQISVLSMAQAVTEKRQNPPAAENSQTQSSFREMLADRRKALDKGGEEAFPTEKPEEENHGESTVSRTDSDMERMLWAAFGCGRRLRKSRCQHRRMCRVRGASPCSFCRKPGHLESRMNCKSRRYRHLTRRQPWRQPNRRSSRLCAHRNWNGRGSGGHQRWARTTPECRCGDQTGRRA